MKEKLERKLYIGIPRGSLNRPEPNRGNTKLLLETAGWRLRGYRHRQENDYPQIIGGDKEVQFFVMRPRTMPPRLENGFLDLAICGRDTMEEYYSLFWQQIFRDIPFTGFLKKERSNELRRTYATYLKEFRKEFKDLRNEPWYLAFEEWYLLRRRGFYEGGSFIYHLVFKKIWQEVYSEIKKEIEGNRKDLGPYELCDLGYGKVDLSFAIETEELKRHKKLSKKKLDLEFLAYEQEKEPLVCSTPYPNIAFREFCRYFPSQMIGIDFTNDFFRMTGHFNKYHKAMNPKPIIIIPTPGGEMSVRIYQSDVVLECVASRESLQQSNLVSIGEPILTSTARLYTTSSRIKGLASSLEKINEYFTKQHLRSMLLYDPGRVIYDVGAGDAEWRQEKIQEVSQRLQEAARKYGEIRSDSVYFRGKKG